MRIDDRLLHAQVSLGWVGALSPDAIVVADDIVASTPGQAELMGMGLPENVELIVTRIDEANEVLKKRESDRKKYILLVRNPRAALRILRGGLPLESLNVGGMHFSQGKKKIFPYLFADEEDSKVLEEIASMNVKLVAQDVPGNPSHDVMRSLRKGKVEEN